MSIQFVIGNSGSGKTEYMFRYITREAEKNPKKNYLVIVPEQFTLQTQKKLVELSARKVIMNVDVLSFKRLAYRVFDDLGIQSVHVLEETGKNLVIRKVAQQLAERLPVLGTSMNRMGYVSQVKSLISELMQYKISSHMLDQYLESEELAPGLRGKLQDVSVLYHGFEDFLRSVGKGKKAAANTEKGSTGTREEETAANTEKGSTGTREEETENAETELGAGQDELITAEELLTVLEHHVRESELLRDSVVVFDEFTGFTPIQNHLLAEIMKQAKELLFSVTMDAGEDFWHSRGTQELFHMPKEMIRILMKTASENHIAVRTPIVLGEPEKCRYADAPELAFLEKKIFRPEPAVWKEEPAKIRLTSCKDPEEELVITAREIRRLIREEGMRYREIGIVTGDVEGYGSLAPDIFEKYRIPVFIDTTKELLFHPFIEMIRAILEVIRGDYSYEAVFRFLRCGFFDISEEDMDHLDNYVRAKGIRGKNRWKRPWTRLPILPGKRQKNLPEEELLIARKKLENLNFYRKEIYEWFAPIGEIFSEKESTVRQQIRVLYQQMEALGAAEKLDKRAGELRESVTEENEGYNQTRALEYEQIYGIVTELLEKYAMLLGDESLDIREFTEILDAGLDAAQVATIPPKYDCVTFGDIERTRQNHIKVLFFIGVNDGIIPKSQNGAGLISQLEREFLRENHLSLAPGAREETFIQRYYLYLNMTKPSRRLYISYTRVDSGGKARRPSYLIGTLKNLFPKLCAHESEEWGDTLDCSTPEAALDYLVRGSEGAMEDESRQWYSLAHYFMNSGRPPYENWVEQMLDAAYEHYSPEQISRVIAEKLYGREIRGSVTRLEQFAICAYAHFLQYGLQLAEREKSGFAPVDMGNIYHDALMRYSILLEKSDSDWFTVSEARQEELCQRSIEEALQEREAEFLADTQAGQHMLERMRHVFRQTVWALTEQVRKGKFKPQFFEISFREAGQDGEWTRSLGENRRLLLDGRIDRIDIGTDPEGYYIKVIDYKSGSTKFDLLKIYQGTQLQLMVYMNAALKKAAQEKGADLPEPVPGGVFYYHIDDPVLENKGEMTEEEAEHALLEALRPDGLVNAEEHVFRLMDEDLIDKSEVIPIKLKKDGTPGAGSSVATEEEFAVIGDFVNLRLKQAGTAILDGEIAINPRDEGASTRCNYCPYQSVCRMDTRIPGYRYRKEKKMKREEILERMEIETKSEE